jgi:DNA-nicking Smr family endonuclease
MDREEDNEPSLWQRISHTLIPLRVKKKNPSARMRTHIFIDRPGSELGLSHNPVRKNYPSQDTEGYFLEKGDITGTNRRTAENLKQGNITIEARLDLHGITSDKAKQLLEEFILLCHQQQKRYVLVITGKGMRGEGIIFREAPHWLNQPAIKRCIASYTPAHPKDGGVGALYILLKKR